jgi:hypothetical protein
MEAQSAVLVAPPAQHIGPEAAPFQPQLTTWQQTAGPASAGSREPEEAENGVPEEAENGAPEEVQKEVPEEAQRGVQGGKEDTEKWEGPCMGLEEGGH